MALSLRDEADMPSKGARTDVLIGVDVGGTTTSGGLVTAAGDILFVQQAATHGDGQGTALKVVLGTVYALLEEAQRRGLAIVGIGIGVPAPVDPQTEVCSSVPLVPELT